jgi:hypothetical protein
MLAHLNLPCGGPEAKYFFQHTVVLRGPVLCTLHSLLSALVEASTENAQQGVLRSLPGGGAIRP